MGVRGVIAGSALARLRQGAARLLAAGLLTPTASRSERILDGVVVLEELGSRDFAFGTPIRDWVDALREADPSSVVTEHVRLFGSGMDGALCPPMSSQYLGGNLHGDPARFAARIEGLMRKSGFSLNDPSLPPDHLVVQLELLSALCKGEAAAREVGVDVIECLGWQQDLVGGLRRWVTTFAHDVTNRDRSGAYGPLAHAISAYVDHDHDLIRLIADPPENSR